MIFTLPAVARNYDALSNSRFTSKLIAPVTINQNHSMPVSLKTNIYFTTNVNKCPRNGSARWHSNPAGPTFVSIESRPWIGRELDSGSVTGSTSGHLSRSFALVGGPLLFLSFILWHAIHARQSNHHWRHQTKKDYVTSNVLQAKPSLLRIMDGFFEPHLPRGQQERPVNVA